MTFIYLKLKLTWFSFCRAYNRENKERRSIYSAAMETKSIRWPQSRSSRYALWCFDTVDFNCWSSCCKWVHIIDHLALQKETVNYLDLEINEDWWWPSENDCYIFLFFFIWTGKMSKPVINSHDFNCFTKC